MKGHCHHPLPHYGKISTFRMMVGFFFSYQDLTNFIWPLVGYQVSVDLSKLIPYVHQPWKDKQNTPTKQVCWKQAQGNKRKKKSVHDREQKRIFHWHEVNNISMASGQKATLVGNLKICNLAALISRIWSLTVHGVTQCNLLTWLHWSGAKESHFGAGSSWSTSQRNRGFHFDSLLGL